MLNPGTRIGPYEIQAPLGAGGMGEVFRARDTRLARDVALKVVPDLFASDPERLARFEREAKTLATLNHPHIAQIYGLEQSEGVHALAMELVDGEDLAARLLRGPLPWAEALPIARQIADALEAAHEKGIVHRDLKPANVALTTAGQVKVLDFGLAKAESLGAALAASPTFTSPVAISVSGVVIGTAAYMSPEQAKGRPADKRSDIWAFGCVLFEMVTGTRAFGREDMADTFTAVLRDDPDWSAWPPGIPHAIRTLVEQCLVKDRAERVSDIAVARYTLLYASRAPRGDSAAPALAGPARHWRALLAGVAVLALAVAALAVPAIRHLREGPPARPSELRADILTAPTSDPFSFALSPDGHQLAYVANDQGVSRLWIRTLSTGNAQALRGTDGASYPFWSPDSRSIAFFADSALQRLDIASSAAQRLAPAAVGRGGTWAPNNVILFTPDLGAIFRIPASGGKAEPVTALVPGQTAHRFPEFLPGYERFLYFAQGGLEDAGVYVASLSGGTPTRLLGGETAARYVPGGWLLFLRQNTLLAQRFDDRTATLSGDLVTVADPVTAETARNVGGFSASPSGAIAYRQGFGAARQLQWFDRAGKKLGSIAAPDSSALNFVELSPDGRRVATSRVTSGNIDLWLLDATRLSRFTFDPSVESRAIWSSRGDKLVFRSARSGSGDLYEKTADGSGVETLLWSSQVDEWPDDMSPDGALLIFETNGAPTGADLWVFSYRDRKAAPWLQSRFDERQAQFSPDGRWVAYQSNESGPNEIYVRAFPTGGQWQVSSGGGVSARWSADGKEVFYLAPNGRLMAAPIVVRRDVAEPGVPAPLFMPETFDRSGGLRQQYDVAADGRFLINVAIEQAVAPITLLLNWKP